MKHVLNIALMAVVILGLAMLEATNWGYAVLAIPASDLGQVGAQPSAQTAGSGCCFLDSGCCFRVASGTCWYPVLWRTCDP